MSACVDNNEKEKNEKAALTLGFDYFTGIHVTILDVDPQTREVTFSSPGSEVKHKAVWGNPQQMWSACPSPFPSHTTVTATDPPTIVPGQLPPINAEGELYLEKNFVLNAPGKFNKASSDPKFPKNMPITRSDVKPLRVCATRMVISGFEMLTENHLPVRELDIMDLAYGAPRQEGIRYDEKTKTFTLWLTRAAFDAIGVTFDGFKDLVRAKHVIDNGAKGNPGEMAWAWGVVARCAADYPEARRLNQVSPQAKADLAALLGHSLPES